MAAFAERMRVLIVCVQPLLCEGIHNLLAENDALEIAGPVALESAPALLEQTPVDIIVLAGEKATPQHAVSFNALLERSPHIPVIQAKMAQHTLRLYWVQEVPASADALFQALQTLSDRSPFPEITE